jgi:LPXTG-site transpeptidase (sortase) family protein
MIDKALIVTPIYVLATLLVFVRSDVAEQAVYDMQTSSSSINVTTILDDSKKYSGVPMALNIPRLKLKLGIVSGAYDASTKTWTLSRDKAHYAMQTEVNNNRSGLTLIYGHNTKEVFQKTTELKKGDLIEITATNGHVFVYRYQGEQIVAPTDTTIFEYSGKPRLSLMSCTGLWNENRRIMNFELIRVDSR